MKNNDISKIFDKINNLLHCDVDSEQFAEFCRLSEIVMRAERKEMEQYQ